MLNKKPWKLWEAILLVSPFILSIGFAQLAASRAPTTGAPAEFSMGLFLLNSAIFVAYAACATGILMSKYELNINDVFGFKTGPSIELLPIAFIIGFAIVPPMLILQSLNISILEWLSNLLMNALLTNDMVQMLLQWLGISTENIMDWLKNPIEAQQSIKFLKSMDTPTEIAVFSIMPVLQAPLVEEILFRGILFPAMRFTIPRWLAYLIPALLFAGVHLSLLNLVPLFVLALFFAWQYEKTGNLLCPILTHAGFNLCNILIATGVIPLQNLFPES